MGVLNKDSINFLLGFLVILGLAFAVLLGTHAFDVGSAGAEEECVGTEC